MATGSDNQPSPETFAVLYELIEPFNKTGTGLAPETRFSEDLNFDSLVVMEFVAAVEDRFDISVPLNILPDIATIADFAVALEKIVADNRR
jgi:acyl carrier protein